MTNDFYDLLGVGRDASQEDIRRAYRRQVRQYHPDLNDDPRAPAQFTALKKAYETLGDPKERDAYERLGHETYVRKRISGLPSPDQWEIPDGNGGTQDTQNATGRATARPGTGATGQSVGTDHSDAGSGNPSDERTTPGTEPGAGTGSSSNGTSGNGTGPRSSADAGSTAGSSSRTTNGSGSPAATRSRNAASTAGSTGASAGGGDRTTAGDGTSAERSGFAPLDRLRRRVRRISLGWPLIAAADALYLLGLFFYLLANADGVLGLLERASTGGVDGVVAALAAGNGIEPLPAFVRADLTAGTAVAGVFVVAGTAALPSVYFFIIRETRVNRTPWRPSYLYVVGALAPLAGILLDLFVAGDGLLVDAVAYVLLPVGAVVGLPLSAFVRPRVKRFFRRTWRRIRS